MYKIASSFFAQYKLTSTIAYQHSVLSMGKIAYKSSIYILLLFLLSATCYSQTATDNGTGQQYPNISQFQFQQYLLNPAYVGSKPGVNIEAGLRGQWLGIDGQPFTQSLAVHLPLARVNSGFGISITNDFIGAERNTQVNLLYSYAIKVAPQTKLSIGTQLSGMQLYLDGAKLITPTGEYSNGINHADNILINSKESNLVFDAGLGLYAKSRNWVLGVSAMHLLAPTAQYTPNTYDTQISLARHYFGFFTYNLTLLNTISLHPSFLIKSDAQNYQMDAQLLAKYNNFVHAGLALRGLGDETLTALIFMFGANITNSLRITYSYDLGIGTINNAFDGAHEISLGYQILNILPTETGKKRYNPRFL